jgi:hypothetical protein
MLWINLWKLWIAPALLHPHSHEEALRATIAPGEAGDHPHCAAAKTPSGFRSRRRSH